MKLIRISFIAFFFANFKLFFFCLARDFGNRGGGGGNNYGGGRRDQGPMRGGDRSGGGAGDRNRPY